jgi:hypothetical protein
LLYPRVGNRQLRSHPERYSQAEPRPRLETVKKSPLCKLLYSPIHLRSHCEGAGPAIGTLSGRWRQ